MGDGVARTFLGYEENRGALYALMLLAIALAVCIAGIVISGLMGAGASESKTESPVVVLLGDKKDDGVTWVAVSDDVGGKPVSLDDADELAALLEDDDDKSASTDDAANKSAVQDGTDSKSASSDGAGSKSTSSDKG